VADTILTFTPARAPSVPAPLTMQPKTNVTRYGDGYSQGSSVGINNNLARVSLLWDSLTTEELYSIEGFLRARAGIEAFLYALPAEVDPEAFGSGGSLTRMWVCDTWTSAPVGPLVASLSAEFEEVVRI